MSVVTIFFLLYISNIAVSFAVLSLLLRKMAGDAVRPVVHYSFLLTAFFPVIGIAAAAILLMSYVKWRATLKSGLYGEYEEYVGESGETDDFVQRYLETKKKIKEEISFDTYADIMNCGEAKDKIKVLSKISANPGREEVQIIKDAINDPIYEVRFFASGALMKVESKLMEEINETTIKAERRGMPEDFRTLGDQYKRYVDLGLSPADLKKYYLGLACDAFRSSLDIDTEQLELIIDYTNCLIAMEEHEKAEALIDQVMKVWPGNNDLVFLKSKIAFNLGKYNEVVKNLSGLDYSLLPEEAKEVRELWT